ncbi:hypothetical protein [Levilactobacillus andaensis]|uniref:hypothetical protein n=1 Tax=Levilactobacillus andaensis TaxID=2799570 RepID=UPI0019430B87|nr:hypothetical protein [Levilactobacillus andaensis]
MENKIAGASSWPSYRLTSTDESDGEDKLVAEITVAAQPVQTVHQAELEPLMKSYQELEKKITDISGEIDKLTPKADKVDYVLASCSGIVSGLIDILFVGAPNKSKLQNWTDKQSGDIVVKFAKLNGWDGGQDGAYREDRAIAFLEGKFKVPYDSRGTSDVAQGVTRPELHHYDSPGHHPTIVGLVFSIIDQFNMTVTLNSSSQPGILQVLDVSSDQQSMKSKNQFRLQGNSFIGKIFCGCMNWFGHLMSDFAGASNSVGRGAGIPGPIMSLAGDINAVTGALNIPQSNIQKTFYDIGAKMYKEGFDARFEAAQAIPVVFNELLTRTFYAIRRSCWYLKETKEEHQKFVFKDFWQAVKPFNNATINRMILVSSAVFTALDVSAAAIKTGGVRFESLVNVNIVGVGRLIISVGMEIRQDVTRGKLQREVFIKRQQLMFTGQAIMWYRLADVWAQVPATVAALEEAELAIGQSWQKSVVIWADYDQRIQPERQQKIKKLDQEAKREFLDILD